MTKKKFYGVEIPPVSREFAMEVARRFPALDIKPGITQDQIQFNAGQRSVVEWILNVSHGKEVSGDISSIRKDVVEESLLSKLLGIVRIK